MKNKNLVRGNLPIAEWESQISEDRILTDWIWLLAYERFRHGWLSDTKKLMAGPFFKQLADLQVVFYDPDKNIMKSKSFVKLTRRRRKTQNIEVKLLFKAMRGIDIGYY